MRRSSIGNDIVSLLNTNASRAENSQFYSKFLHTSEVNLFQGLSTCIPFYHFVWLCWSIKESVYKFQKRLQPELSFAAGKISVQQIQPPSNEPIILWKNNAVECNSIAFDICFSSVAVLNNSVYYSYSIIAKDLVYTITAAENISDNTFWGIKKINDATYANQHSRVRSLITEKLKIVSCDKSPVIEKTAQNIPYLQKYPELILISLSHHEQFVAYAFQIKNPALIAGF